MLVSPITSLKIDGRDFYIKRDDLFDPYLSGNKYRKLHKLLQTPSHSLNTIISYGGTQSNAMLAIAAMCQQKGWQFLYYTKPLSSYQREHPNGNYALALSLGMEHKEIEYTLYKDFIASLRLNLDAKTYIVDQGGADKSAQEGLDVLAQEIRMQKEQGEIPKEVLSLATPSGTGTTALYLAQTLSEYTVYTTPLIGDKEYLQTQMESLSPLPSNLIILESEKKYRFAKPYKEFYDIYTKLLHVGVEFDLLYAPLMWQELLMQTKEPLLYIHSGGVSGNATMLERYNRMLQK
jgi:1-aminocyclopropane-1-carboxylate deaminase/D-cysteine desulfhydrase-like pyridoxal-dependent ACC family enzyme